MDYEMQTYSLNRIKNIAPRECEVSWREDDGELFVNVIDTDGEDVEAYIIERDGTVIER